VERDQPQVTPGLRRLAGGAVLFPRLADAPDALGVPPGFFELLVGQCLDHQWVQHDGLLFACRV
jgi:hypothetical protein